MPKLYEINNKPPEFMSAINAFVGNPKGFFIISGTNGGGKSFAARAIFEHFYHPHGDNVFITQTDLNLEWQNDLSQWGNALYRLKELVKAPLLVIDDLGTRTPTPAFMDFLYALADKRYTSKSTCGTIITTNMNAKKMREDFGDAFVSRVASGIVVRFDGQDRRAKDF